MPKRPPPRNLEGRPQDPLGHGSRHLLLAAGRQRGLRRVLRPAVATDERRPEESAAGAGLPAVLAPARGQDTAQEGAGVGPGVPGHSPESAHSSVPQKLCLVRRVVCHLPIPQCLRDCWFCLNGSFEHFLIL